MWLKDTILRLKRLIWKNNIVHESFKVAIILKGIDGVLEIISGILLVFLNPLRLNKLTGLLTQHELSEDPKDIVARAMMNFAFHFTANTQYFGIFYLISHGIVKLILITLLWKRKIWAYPVTIISLVIFIMYQLYRYTVYHSIGLIILTIFDIIIIMLTFIEYKRIKNVFN